MAGYAWSASTPPHPPPPQAIVPFHSIQYFIIVRLVSFYSLSLSLSRLAYITPLSPLLADHPLILSLFLPSHPRSLLSFLPPSLPPFSRLSHAIDDVHATVRRDQLAQFAHPEGKGGVYMEDGREGREGGKEGGDEGWIEESKSISSRIFTNKPTPPQARDLEQEVREKQREYSWPFLPPSLFPCCCSSHSPSKGFCMDPRPKKPRLPPALALLQSLSTCVYKYMVILRFLLKQLKRSHSSS